MFASLKNHCQHEQQQAGTTNGYLVVFWQARAQSCSGTSYKYNVCKRFMIIGSILHILRRALILHGDGSVPLLRFTSRFRTQLQSFTECSWRFFERSAFCFVNGFAKTSKH